MLRWRLVIGKQGASCPVVRTWARQLLVPSRLLGRLSNGCGVCIVPAVVFIEKPNGPDVAGADPSAP